MKLTPTHFRYTCRVCKKEIQHPIRKDDPEATDIPTCCTGSRRDMAYQGLIYEGGNP